MKEFGIFVYFAIGIYLFVVLHNYSLSKCDMNHTPKYSNYGVVIEKKALPAERGINPWTLKFEYRPDRYRLILKMDNGVIREKDIDGVNYSQTNIGDRAKYYDDY